MNQTKNEAAYVSARAKKDTSLLFGLAAVIIFFIGSGFVSYRNTTVLIEDSLLVSHTHEVITAVGDIQSLLKDAETGQRGYLIAGDDKYLEPYNNALKTIDQSISTIQLMTRDNPAQQVRIPSIQAHTHAKLAELAETIQLRRTQGFDAARSEVLTDRGKAEMDALRSVLSDMKESELALRKSRLQEMNDAYYVAYISGLICAALGIILTCVVGYMVRKAAITARLQDWLQSGQLGLSGAMLGEQKTEKLAESVLAFLANYVGAHAAVMFVRGSNSVFRRLSTYGIPENSNLIGSFNLGDGLLGQSAQDKRAILVHDVPDGYITIGSSMGASKPRHLAIIPVHTDGTVNAVIEFGFINPVDALVLELLNRSTDAIGVAIRSAEYRATLQNLLEETQRQAEELQSQSEELRVNNEELEEQSRALKESQFRLEQQQAEMEQTNAQLEEQTTILEGQRDDLARAKSTVQLKAQELERASQYKSDFLANMSHELRTPLNSLLILAKLLGDNSDENLTAEQVKFAQTIQSSGNDLLALINDILDLSKIEAGHMQIMPAPLSFDRLSNDLLRTFKPLAQQKGLAFEVHIQPNCPRSMETDRQRLEQILRNLLANAIKFTSKGKVEVSVSKDAEGRIAFAVSDTGIGIASDHQHLIFEAFRQADGTISRKYGGTGLGLSISRELVRLLGGTIFLKSEVDKGSTFIISIPEKYDPSAVHAGMAAIAGPLETSGMNTPPLYTPAPSFTPAPMVPRSSRIEDDRETLTGDSRIILIVEDDETFASILSDLVHELEFKCLIATTAEEALIMAKQYLPSAVVLDVGLPDNSGLSVLDRMKHDARMRHIPVHVVSGGDYEERALSLGAVGYLLKPVERNDLVDALKQLESKLAHRMRRVLIVEDDKVQQDSMRKLLKSHDVDTVGVGTVGECLEQLEKTTFDCMVLDLSLPDGSGFSLLETLSKEDAYSFPPVIVYTGRDLSPDEEQKLRRYSKSIIIKGVKSPERLLDEVTLFLHQVVSDLPPEQQKMIEKSRNRDAMLESRHILIVEDDVRNVYALTSIFEHHNAHVYIARNGREALDMLTTQMSNPAKKIDLVLMDVMMPEMDGLTATQEIRKNPEWKKLPIIMLTAKAMRDDQERCLAAGANDYMAKPLDVEKLLSLVRVWMPR